MEEIKLRGKYGEGLYALVSDEDYDEQSQHKWFVNSNGYAQRTLYTKGVFSHEIMHRKILTPPKGFVVDHINGDKLDNRRENLRVCTVAENSRNRRISSNNTSGYKGVSYHEKQHRWTALIKTGSKHFHIGTFESSEEAASAYDYYALEFFGEFAKLNFPNKNPVKPKTINPTSNYRGVYWGDKVQKWCVQIQKDKVRHSGGNYICEKQAALAYNAKAKELFGDKARLNVIQEVAE